MNYDNDLFISYSHLDDQFLPPAQQGWVSQFHAYLEKFLTWNLGHPASIWLDRRRLSGNDVFPREIADQLAKVAILIAVQSPCYEQSDWCRDEIEAFCKAAKQNGEIVVDNKARIFKVILRPPKSQSPMPPFMKDVSGYEFYVDKDGCPFELDPTWPDQTQKFTEKVKFLADDIAELIRRLRELAPDVEPSASARIPIYVGQCSVDRKEDRDHLLADLKRCGYPVFPNKPLPTDDEEAFVAEASRMLEQCSLSIHLVGSGYGLVPDGPSQKSVVVLENELAVRRSKAGALSRIIWLPDSTVPKCQQQQQFILSLGRDPEVQYGADLITKGLEDLKSAVHATLQKLQRERSLPANSPRPDSAPKFVYVIDDKQDRDASFGLKRWLTSKGFEVTGPVTRGKAAAVRKANEETLALCDTAILFYGAGDEAWKRTVENDLRKANACRGSRPPFLTYTYMSGPATDDKREMLGLGAPNIINGLEGFSEAAITPLLNALRKV